MDSIVALFAGAGGLSTGFSQSGLKPAVAVELDADACGTYARNLGLRPLQMDVSDPATIDAVLSSLRRQQVGAVIGGPPCQGFSTAGGRLADDPRNRLIFSYLRMVETLKPRWFLFENVEGLLTSGGGRALVNLVRAFVERGYSLRLEKVNFAAFGLPQTRKRVIIVGNRIGADFNLPTGTHSYNSGKSRSRKQLPLSPSVDDALAGLGAATQSSTSRVCYTSEDAMSSYDAEMRDGMTDVSLHSWNASEADRSRFPHLQPGQTMKDLPEELWHSSFKRRAFRRVQDGTATEKRGGAPSGVKRLIGSLNALTVTSAASREFVHPQQNRPLTLREAARLQSFPDSYEFDGPTVSKARQIGNAFPPLYARALAQHISEIDGTFGSDVSPGRAPPRLIDFVLTEASGMSPALQLTYESLSAITTQQIELTLAAE